MDLYDKIPATEVKLMLKPKAALDKGFALPPALTELFDISGEVKDRPVWYVDTPDQKFRNWGWSVRFRRSMDELELTYKKRYSESGYRAMLQTPLGWRFWAGVPAGDRPRLFQKGHQLLVRPQAQGGGDAGRAGIPPPRAAKLPGPAYALDGQKQRLRAPVQGAALRPGGSEELPGQLRWYRNQGGGMEAQRFHRGAVI